MVKLTLDYPDYPDPNALSEDELTLLKLFKGLAPDTAQYMNTMRDAFTGRVVELENAQERLAGRGYIQLIQIPRTPGSLDRVKPAALTLDGYRKLQEIDP
ncbi:hypothetical protein [Rhizobium laguerreae]|uniref:hypothetical protein n=1 Tax=Rhizobium laguerreae TaxID=1076926 RepID=UPI001C909931|nr:hypothetical protein [Rhizobium laguerreae]MBY3038922.1 hypothetical protein [Rhizobium laguerreae]